MERKQFIAPDLHAPRNRPKTKDILAYPRKDPHGFFARLKKEHPQLKKYSNREIASWIEEYCKVLAQEVVDNRKGVKLPNGLGVVITGLCKLTARTASRNIDFKTSKHLGVLVPYQNLHTDGYTAKIYWFNKIPGSKFKPCRALSRAVSATVKNGGYSKYIVCPTKHCALDTFRKPKIGTPTSKEKKHEEAVRQLLEVHDEFKFD